MSKNIDKKDIESIEKLITIVDKSMESNALILNAGSEEAAYIGKAVGGTLGASIATAGIAVAAGSAAGSATLGAIGVGMGAGSIGVGIGGGAGMAGIGLAGMTALPPLAIAAAIGALIAYFIFKPSEEEQKLNSRLKEAIEKQNKVIEKINQKKIELEEKLKSSEINAKTIKILEAKILELLEINEALVKEIKALKMKYNID